ncbi:adrenodoxin-like protein 2, mitochondrial [Anopheles arabiensis]|uniref:AGAP003212-PA n=4 Tax=gambiae species complex TaxID=44542 RepID=Q7QBE1_ANOGA|nr:adrenodoxin-like protein 2, mitochondrial [Anopheles arabiensis]XP_312921.3 adrenodoxin-like protein 2, mitochondrial [Anopheles gambiae]EAA08310.3 AGAP003212-PA [Anopheles gambiae str. PEST]
MFRLAVTSRFLCQQLARTELATSGMRALQSATSASAFTSTRRTAHTTHGISSARSLSTSQPKLQSEEVEVTFVRANGERVKAKGKIGDSLLDVIVNNNIDFEGFGACEGTLTCSTCHLIFSKADYDRLPEKPSDEELDMLDLAYELTDTSRLGCQITLSKDLEGLEVRVPATINDARS